MGIYVVIVLMALMFLIATVLVGDRYAEQCAESLPELPSFDEEDTDSESISIEAVAEEILAMNERKKSETAEKECEEGRSRFYMLNEIDQRMETYEAPAYDDSLTLEELCNRFRAFSANKLGLYYDIADIRRFIAGLSVTHVLIMQGMSGTGKTSLAYAFGEFLQNQSVIIPIQPMWKERTDMIGYYNEFTKRFNETVLLRKMYEADCNDEIYITVLDEMNIARVEYYFAEFLSLLEIPNPEKRYLDVVSDKWEDDPKMLRDGQIQLPPNMWFIGTANNDDSTFAISDKVYDRAIVMNLDKKADVFSAEEEAPVKISCAHFMNLIEEARKTYALTERNRRRLAMLDQYLMDKFRITFGNRIVKQINQYIPVCLACGGDELDALDDILSRKVLRKLEAQNPVYVRSAADGLCVYLDDLFGADRMPLCKEYLRRLERTA
jgi:RNAse (barnase) inhibitor barstar